MNRAAACSPAGRQLAAAQPRIMAGRQGAQCASSTRTGAHLAVQALHRQQARLRLGAAALAGACRLRTNVSDMGVASGVCDARKALRQGVGRVPHPQPIPHHRLCIPSHLQHAAVARVELSLAAQQAGHEEVKQAPQLLHVCRRGMGREG